MKAKVIRINTANNKIYIGVHKTNNVDDGYMSSGGKRFCDAVKHYDSKFCKKGRIANRRVWQGTPIQSAVGQ